MAAITQTRVFSDRFIVRDDVILVLKIPIGFFFALSLTMMLLHVRAEECCLRWFQVCFQVKMILLCIEILPNAFKK